MSWTAGDVMCLYQFSPRRLIWFMNGDELEEPYYRIFPAYESARPVMCYKSISNDFSGIWSKYPNFEERQHSVRYRREYLQNPRGL